MANDSSSGGFLAPSSAAPPEDSALDAILQGLVVGVTGLPGNMVRPRWQTNPPAQPEPTADWCAIGVTDEDGPGNIFSFHDYAANSGNGQTTTQTNVIVEVLASLYGPNARGYAGLIRDGLMIGQNRESLQSQGIAVVEMPGAITFVPAFVNERTYRRADLRFRLKCPFVRVWPILNIQQIQGSIVAENGDSTSFTAP